MSRVRLEWENLGFKTSIEDDSVETLTEVLDIFEHFLRGVGFEVDGKLDIVPEEEYYGKIEDDDDTLDEEQRITVDMSFIKDQL